MVSSSESDRTKTAPRRMADLSHTLAPALSSLPFFIHLAAHHDLAIFLLLGLSTMAVCSATYTRMWARRVMLTVLGIHYRSPSFSFSPRCQSPSTPPPSLYFGSDTFGDACLFLLLVLGPMILRHALAGRVRGWMTDHTQ
jgi:hypothetical protein